jgi:hypothetical protein
VVGRFSRQHVAHPEKKIDGCCPGITSVEYEPIAACLVVWWPGVAVVNAIGVYAIAWRGAAHTVVDSDGDSVRSTRPSEKPVGDNDA